MAALGLPDSRFQRIRSGVLIGSENARNRLGHPYLTVGKTGIKQVFNGSLSLNEGVDVVVSTSGLEN